MNISKVEIMGREYTVRSDEGEEWIAKIAEYVNAKIKEVSENTKTISTLNIAILTALNIANDYFKLSEAQRQFSQKVESSSSRLVKLIDSQDM
jgi:cell division protein ZapA